MKDISETLRAGKAVFKSTQTATCFPGRERAFRTGVKADPDLVDALPILVNNLEQPVELDLISDPLTDEVLVTVRNIGSESFLVDEGDTLCSERPVSKPAPAVEEVAAVESAPEAEDIIE